MIELRKKGMKGGLKAIADSVGYPRPPELGGVDGAMAVKLWDRFTRTKDEAVLSTLLFYNAWDVALTHSLHGEFVTGGCSDSIHESIPFDYHGHAFADDAAASAAQKDSECEIIRIPEGWSMEGIEFCFTGEMKRFSREEASERVRESGGIVRKTVTKNLDYLVVGDTGKYGKTSKVKAAEENYARGMKTHIIEEDDFATLLLATAMTECEEAHD
jgi:NAD-dependent DNA ligase